MAERKRNKEIHFYVTEEERKLIRRKMIESKTKNMGAYLRKMAIDGYIVNTDTTPLKKQYEEMHKIGVNINQIAKKVNTTGDLYPEEMQELKEMVRLTALNCLYSKINISSIGAFTALEISIANLSDGLYCAFSNLIIVSRRTPTMSASCSCVNSCATRYFFKLHTNFASIIYFLFS